MKHKPCPFCGEEKFSGPMIDAKYIKWAWIECCNCGAHGPDVRTDYTVDDWHEKAWNEWDKRWKK